mgnify:CR=1 FL=1|jgi:hypothetical protein
MQINIGIIKIHVITNVGSLNVGKTILCNNRATVSVQPEPAEPGGQQAAEESAGSGGLPHETPQRSVDSP